MVYNMARNQLTPTKAQMKKIPALYTQEDEADPVVYVRYFFGGRGAFYATECNPETMTFFGYMISPLGRDCDELGYITLEQLVSVAPAGMVERDQYFSPKPMSEACKQNGDPLPTMWMPYKFTSNAP